MHTIETIFKELGGPAAVARAAGAEPNAARQWKRRESIPGIYWPAVVGLARSKRVKGVSIELLADLARKARDRVNA